ncbi:MAG: SPFH domain-containing protein [Patescibacteria group bacterium]
MKFKEFFSKTWKALMEAFKEEKNKTAEKAEKFFQFYGLSRLLITVSLILLTVTSLSFWLGIIATVFLPLLLIKKGFVEKNEVAAVYFLKRHVKDIDSGLYFIFRFFEEIKKASTIQKTLELEIKVKTVLAAEKNQKEDRRDEINVIIPFTVSLKPRIGYLRVFFKDWDSIDNLQKKLTSKIISYLGEISLQYSPSEFVNKKAEIQLLINFFLRSDFLPHKGEINDLAKKHWQEIRGLGFKESVTRVELKDRLGFYNKFHDVLNHWLNENASKVISPIEESFGIEIEEASLETPEYGKELNAAIETRIKAQKKAEEVDVRLKEIKKFQKALMKLNGTKGNPEFAERATRMAINEIDQIIGGAKNTIHTITGENKVAEIWLQPEGGRL